jgi:hypothetical protein
MKQKQTRAGMRLLITFEPVQNVNQALNLLSPLMAE